MCGKLVVIQKQPARGSFYIERRARDRPRSCGGGHVGYSLTVPNANARRSVRHPYQSLEHTPPTNYVNGPSASAPPALTLRDMLTRSCSPHYLPRSPYPTPPPPLQTRASRSGLRYSTPRDEPLPSVVTTAHPPPLISRRALPARITAVCAPELAPSVFDVRRCQPRSSPHMSG